MSEHPHLAKLYSERRANALTMGFLRSENAALKEALRRERGESPLTPEPGAILLKKREAEILLAALAHHHAEVINDRIQSDDPIAHQVDELGTPSLFGNAIEAARERALHEVRVLEMRLASRIRGEDA